MSVNREQDRIVFEGIVVWQYLHASMATMMHIENLFHESRQHSD